MKIRPYTSSDSVRIADFMQRCFVEDLQIIARSMEPDYYVWKYADNYRGKPVAWIAEHENQIIGMLGLIPKRFQLDGREVLCGEMVDAFIDPRYRGSGVFQELTHRVISQSREHDYDLLYGSPNKISLPIWTKLYGFRLLFEYRSLVRPIRFDSIVYRKIRYRWMSLFLGLMLRLVFGIFFGGTGPSRRISLEKTAMPDSTCDPTWKDIQSRFSYAFVKTRSYLEWRYAQNPEPYALYLIRERESRAVIGYAVIKFNEIKGLRFAHVVDLVIDETSKKELLGTIRSILAEMHEEGADFASIWAVSEGLLHQACRKFGFFARKKRYWMMMRSEKKEFTIPERMSDIRRWSFSHGDTDNI